MAKFFLPNPGFELGDQNWTKGGGWAILNNVASRTGAWVAQFTGTAALAISSGQFAVRPGGKLTTSFYFDGAAATAGIATSRVRWFDHAGITISDVDSTGIVFGSGYTQEVLLDTVAPNRAKLVDIRARVNGSDGSTWWVDDGEATGDIIESIPTTVAISGHRMVPADTIGVFDPLIGQDKFTEFNAGMSDKWSGVFTFIPALGADLGELVSFIRRLGRTERFFAFDPDRTVPINGIVNGMTVDGPITNGTNKISVKAGPVSSTALVAGDYIEVKDQYFQVQRPLEIGPEGTGEAIVFPAVRSTLADGEDVITNNPKMVARITSDLDWRRIEARPVELTIAWEEV